MSVSQTPHLEVLRMLPIVARNPKGAQKFGFPAISFPWRSGWRAMPNNPAHPRI